MNDALPPARQSGFWQRLKDSIPSFRLAVVGGILWAIGMSFSAFVSLWFFIRLETVHLMSILLLYAAGAFLAFPIALFFAAFLGAGRRTDTRFAASFLSLSFWTLAITAFMFSQQFRLFYAQWHDDFGTKLWLNEFVFTSASAVYQFLISGLRLYLPLGLIELILASLWLAKGMR